ncbi:MAG TPA: hypothetical protein VNH11_15860 [Pirellulales bacterium]|nr:hypothetical protein [Pirellulales bacterium]
MQKNGGNVVSYFLTPQGLVIDAVVGPVKADKLLSDARWAVDTYAGALKAAPHSPPAQANYIAMAHAALSGDKAHRLLADNSLVPLQLIQERVFEKLAGQKASEDRSDVGLAAMGFNKARQKGMPVLLVLTKAKAKTGVWDMPTSSLIAALGSKPTVQPMRNCVLIVLPIDELPALTNLVNLPDLELAERTTPTMVLTNGDAAQTVAISSHSDPREVAKLLWDAVNHERLDKADKLIESGHVREATGLLKLVKSSPQAGPLKARAIERLGGLQPSRAPRATKSATPIVRTADDLYAAKK